MRRLGRRIAQLLVASSVMSLACAHGPAVRAADPAEVRAAIEAANVQFASALVRGDTPAVGAFFTDDGECIYAGMREFIVGRAAIEAFYASLFKKVRFVEASITTLAVQVEGDLAYETGTNKLTRTVGDAAPSTTTARYLVVWKRSPDGRWRIRVDAVVPSPAG
jgi:uncharacterized protein (TIGR02246 family)